MKKLKVLLDLETIEALSGLKMEKLPRRAVKRFYLGNMFPGMYFTAQEAACMKYLLQGYTDKQVGEALELSPRTVSFYCMNMRSRLSCKTRRELIEKVKFTDFYKLISS